MIMEFAIAGKIGITMIAREEPISKMENKISDQGYHRWRVIGEIHTVYLQRLLNDLTLMNDTATSARG